jgi:DNA-binding LacI/PurR family transcriptional regulator
MRTKGFTPRYKIVIGDMKKRLGAGEWKVREELPSSRALAHHYDLSRPMVLRVFRELARAGLIALSRRKLPRVAVPAVMRPFMRDSIGIVLSTTVSRGLRNPYIGRTLEGVFKAIDKSGNTFVVLQHRNQWRTAFPAGLEELQLGGVLLLGPFSPEILHRYENLNVPAVLIDQPGEKYRLHSVGVDNYRAAYDATSRLIASGHQRLAFVRYVVVALKDIDPDSRERQLGFLRACRDAGIQSSMRKIITCYGARHAVKGLIEKTFHYSGVLTSSAEIAFSVKRTAELNNLRVPRDLSICTFNHNQTTDPNWSGPRIDFQEIGQRAVEILKRNPAGIEHVRVPGVWNSGETIGRARH